MVERSPEAASTLLGAGLAEHIPSAHPLLAVMLPGIQGCLQGREQGEEGQFGGRELERGDGMGVRHVLGANPPASTAPSAPPEKVLCA